ncbi:T9SS type A sorting domain-containing protein [Flammeovirga aprica]|uniref:T9SS type A sorting domain-containing protein n=1 Tax=Flammeovirga aprica JL-4 TaxID=694437 RepID=A0A7X9XAX2_9BACT|nr:T9SS type A sorting domain-containing protein [Flammeovirga aprica]NME70049.1 T9SS type A sorting domain-containing protein [Flammeovirga aprica JL-4]
MKYLITFLFLIGTLQSFATNVTFSVDMSNEDVVGKTVYIAGSFNSWSFTALSDDNADNIYELTLDVTEGDHEYKFLIDSWDNEENMSAKGCSNNSNRLLSVTGTDAVVLETEIFNQCGSPTYVGVTFKVDMSAETVTDGVYMTGLNGSWNHNEIQLFDENADQVYEVTQYLKMGSEHTYNYINGNWEDSRDGCDEGKNRRLKVYNEDIVLDALTFGACSDKVEVKFSVNMGDDQPADDAVYMTGLNGWNHNDIKLYDLDGDNIWETTVLLSKNTSYTYNFISGNWEDARENCPEGKNRSVEVGTSHMEVAVVNFGECDQDVVTVSTTFQVDMNAEELVDGKVFIVELNGKWEQQDWVEMTDENDDGIFTATVDLVEGTQNFRYNNGADWNDEGMQGTACGNDTNNNRSVEIVSDGSETPAQLLDVVAFNSCTAEAPTYNITFTVDLGNETADVPGILYRKAGEDTWNDEVALTQNTEETTVWEVTLSLTQGQNYEYLFTNGEDEESSRSDCSDGYLRTHKVSGKEELLKVTYGECDTPRENVAVTFQVDMNAEELVDGKVFIVELDGKWEQQDWVEMMDEDGDGIFTATVELLEGTQKFRYNNGSDWNDEDLSGGACAVDGDRNRSLTVVSDGTENPVQILDVLAFNSCTSEALVYNVTFSVDLADQTASSPGILHRIEGEDIWMDEVPLTQNAEEPSIWEITLSLTQGQTYSYLFTNGDDQESNRAECGDGYLRTLKVNGNEELLTVKYGECDTPPQNVGVTFQVDMNAEDLVDGKVFIVELNGKWEPKDWVEMTDEDNDGIFTATVNLLEGLQVYRYNNGTDWNDENLSGTACGIADSRNRSLKVVGDGSENPTQVVDVVAFNSCSAETPSHEITFSVNLGTLEADTPGLLFKATGEEAWNEKVLLVKNEAFDNVWEAKVALNQGVTYDYQFTNGEDAESGRADCEEGQIRTHKVTGAESLVTVKYGRCDAEPEEVAVTFQVDMNAEELVDGKVFIVELNGKWEPKDWIEMTDENNDGIFTATVTLLEGPQKFRYNNGADWNDEDLSDNPCAVDGDKNRSLNVVSDGTENPTQVLDVVAYNSCSSEPVVYASVTFSIDVSQMEGEEKPYILGSWDNIKTEMTSIGAGVYTQTIELLDKEAFTYLYYYGNTVEAFEGDCLNAEGQRSITVDGDSLLPILLFNSCEESTPVFETVEVTFKVNLANQRPPEEGVFIAGSWLSNNWTPENFDELTDEDNDGIWEVTITLNANFSYEYQFTMGRNWDNTENMEESGCEVAGTKNRGVTTGSEDLILEVVCFNECSICVIDVVNITVSGENITEKGGTSQMTATVMPLNADVKEVKWSISDTSIATIDENGLVTALKDGMVTITATTMQEGSTVSGTKEITITGHIINSLENDLERKISVFPNPSQGIFSIESDINLDEISIYDLRGQLIYRVQPSELGQQKIKVEQLQKGIYLLNISISENTVKKKVIIQ